MVKVRSFEKGLYFRDNEFKGVLGEGRHWLIDVLRTVRVDVVSQRDTWLGHEDLDVIVKSGALENEAIVLDLKDHECALVWIDGRFDQVVSAGQYALWTKFHDVKVEVIDARQSRVERDDLSVILKSRGAVAVLDSFMVEPGHAGVYFKDGEYVETLAPGRYAFWKDVAKVQLYAVDLRESVIDVSGQEIMTADKVTLRMNAVVVYKVTEAKKVAEAALIFRREETAAMRSQANTAKLLENNQTLMRLKELEVLAKIAETSKLNVVLGEKGLAERVMNLL